MRSSAEQPPTIAFYDNWLPPLEAGEYRIEVEHRLTGVSDTQPVPAPFKHDQSFLVVAPRFGLGESDIHSLYPPPNSADTRHGALPQVVFTRRTLPWERSLALTSPEKSLPLPWLAVLLFDEAELAPHNTGGGDTFVRERTAAEALRPADPALLGPRQFTPSAGAESSSLEEQTRRLTSTGPLTPDEFEAKAAFRTVDVPLALFLRTAPAADELAYLAHVRRVGTDDKEILEMDVDGWFSVVIGNRFPKTVGRSVAHLVSLEGFEDLLPSSDIRTIDDLLRLRPGVRGWNAARDAASLASSRLRMISLAAWRFETQADGKGFTARMEAIGRTAQPLRAPNTTPPADADAGEPRRPARQIVEAAFARGYTLLKSTTRLNNRTLAWYRGPLCPVQTRRLLNVPSHCAERAVIIDPDTGFRDESYASAWQIGRLLALANGGFTSELLRWRGENHALIDLLSERLELFSGYLFPDSADLQSERLVERLTTRSCIARLAELLETAPGEEPSIPFAREIVSTPPIPEQAEGEGPGASVKA